MSDIYRIIRPCQCNDIHYGICVNSYIDDPTHLKLIRFYADSLNKTWDKIVFEGHIERIYKCRKLEEICEENV